jgi:hypothetical protein
MLSIGRVAPKGDAMKLCLIVYHSRTGGHDMLSAMADMCNKLPVASVCLRQGDVLAGRHAGALADFASELVAVRDSEQAATAAESLARPA